MNGLVGRRLAARAFCVLGTVILGLPLGLLPASAAPAHSAFSKGRSALLLPRVSPASRTDASAGPVWHKAAPVSLRNAASQSLSVESRFAAALTDASTPPDPGLAVGMKWMIQVVSDNIYVYRKGEAAAASGAQVFGFFHPAKEELPIRGTARAVYDAVSQRFIVAMATRDPDTHRYFVHLAVSARPDSAKAFHRYRHNITQFRDQTAVGNFQVGYKPSTSDGPARVFITYDAVSATTQSSGLVDFDYQAVQRGGPVTAQDFVSQQSFAATRSDPLSTEIFFASLAGGAPQTSAGLRAEILREKLTLGASPTDDEITTETPIRVPRWQMPPLAAQPNGETLATGDGSFTSPTIQIGDRLWQLHVVDDGGFARPEIYEFSALSDTLTKAFRLSSVPERNDHLFNASLAVSPETASVFLNASRTIPSVRADGRAAMVIMAGPDASAKNWTAVTVRTSKRQFKRIGAGQESCNAFGGCLWGPHSSIQIDPTDPRRAWAVNEIAGPEEVVEQNTMFDWETWIGEVLVSGP